MFLGQNKAEVQSQTGSLTVKTVQDTYLHGSLSIVSGNIILAKVSLLPPMTLDFRDKDQAILHYLTG